MPEYGYYREPDSASSDEVPLPRPTSRSRVVDPTAFDAPDSYDDAYAEPDGRYEYPADPYTSFSGPGRAVDQHRALGPRFEPDHPRSTWPRVVIGGLGAALIAVLVNLVFGYLQDADGDEAAGVDSARITTDGTSTTSTTPGPSPGGSDLEPTTFGDPSVVVARPTSGPWIEAVHEGGLLTLMGTVPTDEAAEAIVTIAQLVYSEELVDSSQLRIDDSLGDPPPWLQEVSDSLPLLPLVDSARMVAADGQIILTGGARITDDVTNMADEIGKATGLPVTIAEFQISNLRAAVYVLNYEDDKISLSGALPTEEMRQGFVDAAAELYGEDQVVDASTVDPTVGPEPWMLNPPAMLAVIAAFDDYEVRIEGEEISARLSGGASFEPGSAEVSEALASILSFTMKVLLRDPAMAPVIKGHTDNTGPDEVNLTLSQERADAAKAFLVDAGIESERITAIGVGSAEPIADNDTAEGRTKNRRIEVIVANTGGATG